MAWHDGWMVGTTLQKSLIKLWYLLNFKSNHTIIVKYQIRLWTLQRLLALLIVKMLKSIKPYCYLLISKGQFLQCREQIFHFEKFQTICLITFLGMCNVTLNLQMNIKEKKGQYSFPNHQLKVEALHLLSDRHLSDRRFPDRSYPDHNNIPDHSIDVYIYPDLQLPRPVHINLCSGEFGESTVGQMTIGQKT